MNVTANAEMVSLFFILHKPNLLFFHVFNPLAPTITYVTQRKSKISISHIEDSFPSYPYSPKT